MRVLRRILRRGRRFSSRWMECLIEIEGAIIRRFWRLVRRWTIEPDRWEEPARWSRFRRRRWVGLMSVLLLMIVLIGAWPTQARLVSRYEQTFQKAMRERDYSTAELCAKRLHELLPEATHYQFWERHFQATRSGPDQVARAMRAMAQEPGVTSELANRWLAETSTRRPSLMTQEVASVQEGWLRWKKQVACAAQNSPQSPRFASLAAISEVIGEEATEGRALEALTELARKDPRHWLHVAALAAQRGERGTQREAVHIRLGQLEKELEALSAPSAPVLAREQHDLEILRRQVEQFVCWFLLDDWDHARRCLERFQSEMDLDQASQLHASLAQRQAETFLQQTETPEWHRVGECLEIAWGARAERQSLVRLTEEWLRQCSERDADLMVSEGAAESDTKLLLGDLSQEQAKSLRPQQCASLLLQGLRQWERDDEEGAKTTWQVAGQHPYGLALLNNYAWWTIATGGPARKRGAAMLAVAIQSAQEPQHVRWLAALHETRSRLYLAEGLETEAYHESRSSDRLRK